MRRIDPGDGELSFGALDVVDRPVIDAHCSGEGESHRFAQFARVGGVLDVCCQSNVFAGFFRRCNEAQKFSRFAPEIFFCLASDVFRPLVDQLATD